MEYQVPQFIEVEDKIFGPLSLKQFIFIAGGIGLCVILFLYLPFIVFVLVGLPVAAFSLALAFYKINNKSFIDIVEAAFNFYTKDRLYLWKKERKTVEQLTAAAGAPGIAPTTAAAMEPPREKLRLTEGKLKELAWSLDIKDREGAEEGSPAELPSFAPQPVQRPNPSGVPGGIASGRI